MARSFLPTTDHGLQEWSNNIIQYLGPDPSVFGVAQEQYDDFAALAASYASAFAAVSNPDTRTKALVHAKNDARQLLRIAARRLAFVIYGQPHITNQQLSELRLTVRDISPTPQPIPLAPLIVILSVIGRLVTVLLKDAENPSRRGRPEMTSGAMIYSHVGEELPANIKGWKQEGITGNTTVELLFSDDLPAGTKVWVTAQWFNNRKETGAAGNPVSALLAGSNVQAA